MFETVMDAVLDSFNQYNDIFRQTRNELLAARMSVLMNAQNFCEDKQFDYVDNLNPENTTHRKICPNCNTEAPVSQRTCKLCKGKTLFRQEIEEVIIDGREINPYSHFTVQPNANDVGVVVGEPDMPSFENLSFILQTLGRRPDIDRYVANKTCQNRIWIFIENDGSILNPVLKLIYNVKRCTRCNRAIYGCKNFDSHLCTKAYDLDPVKEFDRPIP